MATHNEVAHAWANQTGKHRKGFNMFYEGRTIYSYGRHFPIASLRDTPERTVVLMTTEKYSVSTSKHVTYTWRACNHMTMYRVPLVEPIGPSDHDYNVKSYLKRITESLEKAKRARVYGPSHMRNAEEMIREAQDYIQVFRVTGYENIDWSPDAIVEGAEEAARIAYEREKEAIRQREIAARKRYREETWPRIKNWIRGYDIFASHTPRPLPRIKGDIVETTWGASVPLDIATKLYWVSIKCRREHYEYIPKTSMRVGDFHLNRIKANGDLVVGCHDIPFWFMHYAAKRNGIPDTQPCPNTTQVQGVASCPA